MSQEEIQEKEQQFREALSEAKTATEIRAAVMLLPDYKPSSTEQQPTSKRSQLDTKTK